MRKSRRYVLPFILILSLVLSFSAGAVSEHTGAYDTYNYSYEDGGELSSAAAYVPVKVVTGSQLGVGKMSTLSDIFIDEARGRLYLADTGNNRLISADMNFENVRIFTGAAAQNGETTAFSGPKGVFVASDGAVYVADTGNKRVVKMTADGKLLQSYGKPDSPQFEQGVDYIPQKVVVSDQGDIAIVCEGIYEGLVSIDQEGGFQGYLGMNLVKPSLWNLFWRLISTRKQLQSMEAFFPVTFINVDLDEDNFIYATSQNEGSGTAAVVQRLNPGGNDVLKNTSGLPLTGDLGNTYVGRSVGYSRLNDVAYLGNGLIACTDLKRSKIFIYNDSGEMLFAFGNMGGQFGDVSTPSGIDNDGFRLYVTDSTANQITIYERTTYGKCIIDGLIAYDAGDYAASQARFEEAFRYNTNSEIAYLGIGKSYLRNKDYKNALISFRLGSNRIYYSKAMKGYRREVFDQYFVLIFALAALMILYLVLRKPVKRLVAAKRAAGKPPKNGTVSPLQRRMDRTLESLDYANYCVFHPFKGFHELKYEKMGSLSCAVILLVLYGIVSMFRATMTGFLFNTQAVDAVNPLWECAKACLPILLFVVANWCITTLMDGEGSMKDIFTAACYAMMPAILGQILLIALSNMIVSEEAGLYYVAYGVIYGWMILLMLIGNMLAHNFTMSRTILATLATLLAMAIIVFVLFLFFNLGFEVVGFITDLYTEAVFRS